MFCKKLIVSRKVINSKLVLPRRYPKPVKVIESIIENNSSMVMFDFVELYARSICTGPEPLECVKKMIVPPPDEQMQIITTFVQAMMEIKNANGLQGVVFKLALTHNDEVLAILIDMIKTFNNSGGIIEEIVKQTQDIPLSTNDYLTSVDYR